MKEVTENQVIHCFQEVGLAPGDGVLVHSAIQYLGHPRNGLQTYLSALRQVIGPGGTIAVPAFNFAFAREGRYDPLNTPSDGMGAFAEYVRQQPGAQRTPHPMQSLAVLGRYAEDLVARDTPSAFDPGSAFERMLELDFKLLLLGADIWAASILHYSEQRLAVPYRYWKDFRGLVQTSEGWQEKTYRMFVRDLEINPQLTVDPVRKLLEERSLWRSIPLNYGEIASCRLKEFTAAVEYFLSSDPWSLVTNRPAQKIK
jgi:aminoglycoside 3-N-acetyltransferase